MEDFPTELTIGELAEAGGVSVRTIRHYEAIGLLAAAERSDGGHRRYGEADLERLRRVLALRRCGFRLDSIGTLLDGSSRAEARALAARQLERVEVELEVGRRLRARLGRLLSLLEADSAGESIDDLIAEMEADEMTPKLDRITTELGDAGETDLADGTRVPKADPTIAAGGAIEELGTEIGLLLAEGRPAGRTREVLERIAHDLFDLGCDLAAPPRAGDGRSRVDAGYVEWLDRTAAELGAGQAPADSFIAYFEAPCAARLNACRATCRRAEREFFTVEGANPQIGRYLNRLSDLLFVLARAEAGGAEVPWRPGAGSAA